MRRARPEDAAARVAGPVRSRYPGRVWRRGAGWTAIAIGAFMGFGILLNFGRGFGFAAFSLALFFCTALPVGIGVALVRGRPSRHLAADEAAWTPGRCWASPAR